MGRVCWVGERIGTCMIGAFQCTSLRGVYISVSYVSEWHQNGAVFCLFVCLLISCLSNFPLFLKSGSGSGIGAAFLIHFIIYTPNPNCPRLCLASVLVAALLLKRLGQVDSGRQR